MIPKRITRIINKILTHPQIIKARFKGVYTDHCASCLTSKQLLNQQVKTVIDVGANVGSFIKASQYVFPQAKIYAFEPVPRLFSKIKKIPQVTAFNFGADIGRLFQETSIALLVPKRLEDDVKLFRDAANTRGGNVHIFNKKKSAIQWLTGQQGET